MHNCSQERDVLSLWDFKARTASGWEVSESDFMSVSGSPRKFPSSSTNPWKALQASLAYVELDRVYFIDRLMSSRPVGHL